MFIRVTSGSIRIDTKLRVTDQEIARLQQQLAIYQTARTAYARALQQELPKREH